VTSYPTCGLCGCNANVPLERHHKVFRSHGGSDADENLVLLCKVCHGAVHGLKVAYNGHDCRSCPVRRTYGCHFGERVLGRPVITAHPWEPEGET
jgi:hypothetical protein